MSIRRLLPLVLINIFVSAAVVLLILNWWGGRQAGPPASAALPTSVSLTAVPGQGEAAAGTPVAAAPTEEAQEAGQPVYTVQPGDTLGAIATSYDVSLDDLMAANGLTDPNFIQVGQPLLIPVGGLPTATPEAPPATGAAATAVPLPTPTEGLVQGDVKVEISEVVGAGRLAEESVIITNMGSQPVGLEGWQVQDEAGNVYTFGQVTLFGDGAGIRLHTEVGQNQSTDLYWMLEQPIWEVGETVVLRDAAGRIQAQAVVGSP